MYMENNDIRSLRDRAPEGCACERGEREVGAACPFSGKRTSRVSGQRADCSGYFISLGAPLAAVYSPIQVWKDVYCETQALASGTLFAELDKPLLARGRKRV